MSRHPSAANDEANPQPHHSLHEQMGQLVDRERVLIGENDQLRAQLVERKEQEKNKFADLMVQYCQLRDNADIKQEDENGAELVQCDSNDIHIKREYEDDEEGTSNNQVTVKTEWNDEEVKEEIKDEYEEDLDSEDPSTNAHNGTELNIKTESMECDLVEVKDEIKEEDDDRDEDCDGCDGCVVKKELVSDDDGQEVANEGGVIRGGDHLEVDDGRYEAIQPNVDCDQLVSNPCRDSLNASNEDSFNEGGAILGSEQLVNTLNEPTEGKTVTQSGDVLSPWTSTGQDSSRTALNQQATGSTQHNKRKQAQLKRTDKRSKKTLQDDDGEDEDGEDFEENEDGEDIANQDRQEAKVKVLYLNCTESKCNIKLDSLVDLHHHLDTEHRLSPLQCFAMNCNARFDDRIEIRDHIQLRHPQNTPFLCPLCPKEFDSQRKTYQHWYKHHLTGQFQCTFVSDCAQVTNTRSKMTTHQQAKHHSQSNHLSTNQFHCNWPHCSKQCKFRANLVSHIRTQHFGLPQTKKAQKEKNIVDLRDPNEYVRVVVDE